MGLSGAHLPAGTRSVSCFLVNRRTPDEAQPDRAYAFQAEVEVRTEQGFVPRPDLRAAHAGDWDDRVAGLHYAGSTPPGTACRPSGASQRRMPFDLHGVDRNGGSREDGDGGRARGRAVGSSPVSSGSSDELFVNLTVPVRVLL